MVKNMRLKKLLRRSFSPQGLLALFVLAVLVYLIVMPVGYLLKDSLTISESDLRLYPEMKAGQFTFAHWQKTYLSWTRFLGPLRNTLVVSGATMVLALILGGMLAWFTTMTKIKHKGLINFLCVLPYMLPSWSFAMAWIEIFQNRNVGRPTGFLTYLTGLNAPEWLVFGPVPIVICCTLHYFPFAYLTISAALKGLDTQVEEAADLLGAGRLTIMRKITFPLVMPAILSAAILVFSRVMGTFATPSLLGIPVRYQILSTQVYSLTRFGRMSEAASVALALIVLCAVIILINKKVTGTRKNYAVIGGKGGKRKLLSFGKRDGTIGLAILAALFVMIVLPMLLLVYSSFMKNINDWSLANISLHWWIGKSNPALAHGEPGILMNPQVWRGAWNTIRISVVTALLCAVFGLLIGYVVVRMKKTKISGIIDAIAFVPVVIPSIAFGAVYLSIFASPKPFIPGLYGSFMLLVLAAFAKRVPYTTRTGVSSMHQISTELEEAAYLQGASLTKRLVSVILPLAKPGVISGIFLVVTTTMREMSLFVLLMSPGNRVLAGQTFVYSEIGATQLSNTLMVFIMILSIATAQLVNLYERKTAQKSHLN
jgi:iron(III) transport system permease protein